MSVKLEQRKANKDHKNRGKGDNCNLYSYNKNLQDALFLVFILTMNSACFGQIYCPSSGVLILYSQQLEFIILVMLTDC